MEVDIMGCGNPFKKVMEKLHFDNVFREMTRIAKQVESQTKRSTNQVIAQTKRSTDQAIAQTKRTAGQLESVARAPIDLAKKIGGSSSPDYSAYAQQQAIPTAMDMGVGGTGEEVGDEAPEDKIKTNVKKKKTGTTSAQIKAPVSPATTGVQI